MPGDDSETVLDPAQFETELTLSQEDRVRLIHDIIDTLGAEYDEGVPFDAIAEPLTAAGVDEEQVTATLDHLQTQGRVIEFGDDQYVLA